MQTPLHYAAYNGDVRTLRLLLDALVETDAKTGLPSETEDVEHFADGTAERGAEAGELEQLAGALLGVLVPLERRPSDYSAYRERVKW